MAFRNFDHRHVTEGAQVAWAELQVVYHPANPACAAPLSVAVGGLVVHDQTACPDHVLDVRRHQLPTAQTLPLPVHLRRTRARDRARQVHAHPASATVEPLGSGCGKGTPGSRSVAYRLLVAHDAAVAAVTVASRPPVTASFLPSDALADFAHRHRAARHCHPDVGSDQIDLDDCLCSAQNDRNDHLTLTCGFCRDLAIYLVIYHVICCADHDGHAILICDVHAIVTALTLIRATWNRASESALTSTTALLMSCCLVSL